MNRWQRILCATDFSDYANDALEVAIDLARKFDSSLRVVHVSEPPMFFGAELSTPTLVTELIKQQQERAQAGLAHALERCQAAGVRATSQLETGMPAIALVDLSAQVDLLVMGTHGRTGVQHFLLGSVAERVLRLSKCPVLVVPKQTVPTAHAAS